MSGGFRGRRTVTVLVAGVAAALVLVACGGDPDPDAAPAPTSPATSTPATPSAAPSPTASESTKAQPVVPAVLDFTGTTVSGDTFRGSSVAGKPVVLWFWAPWCAVCRSQAPQVSSLVAEYGEDLAVIGIGSLDSGSAIAGFADDVRGPLHLSDPDGALWKRFRISEQSSFVVLDAQGKEVLRSGYNGGADIDAAVKKLLA